MSIFLQALRTSARAVPLIPIAARALSVGPKDWHKYLKPGTIVYPPEDFQLGIGGAVIDLKRGNRPAIVLFSPEIKARYQKVFTVFLSDKNRSSRRIIHGVAVSKSEGAPRDSIAVTNQVASVDLNLLRPLRSSGKMLTISEETLTAVKEGVRENFVPKRGRAKICQGSVVAIQLGNHTVEGVVLSNADALEPHRVAVMADSEADIHGPSEHTVKVSMRHLRGHHEARTVFAYEITPVDARRMQKVGQIIPEDFTAITAALFKAMDI